MRTLIADHPLVTHKLTLLRDARTDTATFRTLTDELVTLLAYEATREIRVAPVDVATPVAVATGAPGDALLRLLEPYGELGRNVAELGIGTNESATLTGNVLEDEKVLGSVHLAFGASAGLGGSVSVPIHLDVVVVDASLTVDGRPVLDAGRYVLDA